MTEQHEGATLKYEHPNLDDAKQMYINAGAYQFNAPPPIAGYWVLPCQNTQYKTMFAGYSKPNWFHRMTMRLMIGWTWEDKK